MSNNIEKAEALRALADIYESGELPAELYDDQPLGILAIYGDKDTRDRAVKVMSNRGHSVFSHGTEDFAAAIGAEGSYYPGVEFAMVVSGRIGVVDDDE